MTAGRCDFTCVRGTTFRASVTVLNPDKSVAYLPSWTIRFDVRRRTKSAEIVLDGSLQSSEIGVVTDKYISVDPKDATIFIEIPADVTSSLDLGVHVYDLELEHSGRPAVVRLLKGFFEVVA